MKEVAHSVLKLYMRSFPVSKGKGRVLSWLWEPLSFGKFERRGMLRQANLKVDCDLRQLIQRTLYFRGSYEEAETDYWMSLARGARTVFDVGANIGVYSLLAAAVNPRAEVHAFEPTKEMIAALRNNVAINGLRNVIVNPVGVGKTSGGGFLQVCRGADGSNEGMNFVTASHRQDSDPAVRVISIDDYRAEKKIKRIDLMKIDIEGGEHDALLGARETLRAQAVGCIFIELVEWAANRYGHSTADIKRMLADSGYKIYKMRAGRLEEVSIKDRHDGDNVIAFAREPASLNV